MNEAWLAVGTRLLVNGEASAQAALSAEGLANNAGRVSQQIDLLAAPRPYRFRWSCEALWTGTPTQGGVLELYIATAPDHDATQIDGDVGNADAALADADMRRNLKYIGCVVNEETTPSVCVASGVFECYARYLSIVVYNTGGTALNATDSNFRFDLQPIYDQGQ